MKLRLKNIPHIFLSKGFGIAAALMLLIVASLAVVGSMQKEVTIIDDNAEQTIVTYKNNIKDVLKQNKIELNSEDRILPDAGAKVTDNMKIYIHRAVPVSIIADGKHMTYLTADDTVQDLLADKGIACGETDKVYPDPDTALSSDMQIRVVRVTQKEITQKQVVAYTNEVQSMPGWEKGIEKVLRAGTNGERLTTVRITYEDGAEKSREVAGSTVTKAPLSHLVAVGTMDTRVISRGETIRFDRMIVMKATSYTNDIANTGREGGHTATGTVPRRDPNGGKWSTVAVDPKVIPLHSRLWVEEYGYAIAEDVGGAVKGNIIDLFFQKGGADFGTWHTHRVKVYILK